VPLLLDTTVLIDVLRGRRAAQPLLELRSHDEVPWVCAVNVEEIWRGLRSGEEDVARKLFAGLRIAKLGPGEGERAGRWRRDFAARGVTLSQPDCLLAAAALSVRARLATGIRGTFRCPSWPSITGPSAVERVRYRRNQRLGRERGRDRKGVPGAARPARSRRLGAGHRASSGAAAEIGETCRDRPGLAPRRLRRASRSASGSSARVQ